MEYSQRMEIKNTSEEMESLARDAQYEEPRMTEADIDALAALMGE